MVSFSPCLICFCAVSCMCFKIVCYNLVLKPLTVQQTWRSYGNGCVPEMPLHYGSHSFAYSRNLSLPKASFLLHWIKELMSTDFPHLAASFYFLLIPNDFRPWFQATFHYLVVSL
uniref:Uncharacterized protein n=1 Tax=Cacopsylla melanoneura TaxID=428564 RepID=A0A8D8R5Z2_9HEMI